MYPVRVRREREAAARAGTANVRSGPRLLNTCYGYASDREAVRRRWPEVYTGPVEHGARARVRLTVASPQQQWPAEGDRLESSEGAVTRSSATCCMGAVIWHKFGMPPVAPAPDARVPRHYAVAGGRMTLTRSRRRAVIAQHIDTHGAGATARIVGALNPAHHFAERQTFTDADLLQGFPQLGLQPHARTSARRGHVAIDQPTWAQSDHLRCCSASRTRGDHMRVPP